MALGTIASMIAAPLISGAVSYGASRLFGGGSSGSNANVTAPVQNFRPTGFAGGGLNATYDPAGNLTVAPTSDRLGYTNTISAGFGQLANELGGLRSRVQPGVGELSRARLAEVDAASAARLRELQNSRTAAIGNLSENLARRRVLGSSFGQDALSRAESEFAQQRERVQAEAGAQRDRIAAESFLQEFELTNNLINQQYEASRRQFQTQLDELNLQADVASKLSATASKSMADNAQFLAALNARQATAAGQFFGQQVQPIAQGIGRAGGSAINYLLGGSGGATPGYYGGSPETNPNLRPI